MSISETKLQEIEDLLEGHDVKVIKELSVLENKLAEVLKHVTKFKKNPIGYKREHGKFDLKSMIEPCLSAAKFLEGKI